MGSGSCDPHVALEFRTASTGSSRGQHWAGGAAAVGQLLQLASCQGGGPGSECVSVSGLGAPALNTLNGASAPPCKIRGFRKLATKERGQQCRRSPQRQRLRDRESWRDRRRYHLRWHPKVEEEAARRWGTAFQAEGADAKATPREVTWCVQRKDRRAVWLQGEEDEQLISAP